MRRYVRTHELRTLTNFCEYKQDFLPLIDGCIYNDGSLKQSCLETAVKCVKHLEPLSPVAVDWLTPENQLSLAAIISESIEESCEIEVLSMFLKCNSLRNGGFLLGSTSGRHHLQSLIFMSQKKLARIRYYAKISYIIKGRKQNTSTVWIAFANVLLEHPCQVWFGYPTEVWTNLKSTQSRFILISCFSSRVVYTLTEYNFGRLIGTNFVLICVCVKFVVLAYHEFM